MESCFDQRLVWSCIVIIIIIILAFIIFRNKYQTEEERNANRGRLWGGIIIFSVIAVLAIYLLFPENKNSKHNDSGGEEYGYWDTFRKNVAAKKGQREAYKVAKAAGATEDQARQAQREAKWQQKEVKVAGQQAAFEAEQKVLQRQAERAKN